MNPNIKATISVAELARAVGVTESAVRVRIKLGKIAPVGGSLKGYVLDAEEIARWHGTPRREYTKREP